MEHLKLFLIFSSESIHPSIRHFIQSQSMDQEAVLGTLGVKWKYSSLTQLLNYSSVKIWL